MRKIHLQKATEKDTRLIFNLADMIWHEHYTPIIGKEQVDYMLDKMYSRDSLLKQMTEGHKFYLIEWIDKNPIGFIAISRDSDIFIHKFYINNDIQNKGVGTEVFELLKKLYPTAQSYRLTVNRQNFKAVNFYFKNGFKIESVEDFDIGNGYFMNDFVMKWSK